MALLWKNVFWEYASCSVIPTIMVHSPSCCLALCHTVHILMFSLPLPLPDPLLSLLHPLSVCFFPPPIPISCLYFTRPCSSIWPGNEMWQESVRFERMRNGPCESLLLFLNTCFLSRSAREALFQQMGKTEITINLFFEKDYRASNVIRHICFIVQRGCVRVCVVRGVLQDLCV